MNSADKREAILLATLGHVPFDGWTRRALTAGARDAGLKAIDGQRAFPAGMLSMVEYFFDFGDRQMAQSLAGAELSEMRVRARVTFAVRMRLSAMAAHREAVRRALSFLALPQNTGAAAACTYRTVDTIWYAAGDTSTDFSFYTKRALLAGVYVATVLYWLGDKSAGSQDTWGFLDRRISAIMRIRRANP
ncbi:MAG: COQ9 family protein [Alphaproteobacteria bacterium]|nr:COQ9 family protein [Alphaproteobacteria bacterium]